MRRQIQINWLAMAVLWSATNGCQRSLGDGVASRSDSDVAVTDSGLPKQDTGRVPPVATTTEAQTSEDVNGPQAASGSQSSQEVGGKPTIATPNEALSSAAADSGAPVAVQGFELDAGSSATISDSSIHGDPASRDTEDLQLNIDFDPADCPPLDVAIDTGRADEYEADRGVLVKVLQHPEFTDETRGVWSDPPVPPSEFDRSEFPAGACVVRMRGVLASCYANPASIATGGIIGLDSYHAGVAELNICEWPVPGCPGDHWEYYGVGGYWWYLSERATDTLMIACAPACKNFFAGNMTLKLRAYTGIPLCGGG